MQIPGHVAIKDISPTIFDNGSLRGVVSLRWPYSTSQHAISIQLSDEDVRRRSDKGQVKLTFHGSAAKVIKDLPSLTLLELSATTNSVTFAKSSGTAKDADYSISFVGNCSVVVNGQAPQNLDSKPIAADTTPARTKRTWLTPNLKRSAPSDGLGLEDSWFSQGTPDTKRKRYSSSFKFIDSAQATPAKSIQNRIFGDENSNASQTSLLGRSASPATLSASQTSSGFRFQAPIHPIKFELVGKEDGRQVDEELRGDPGSLEDIFANTDQPQRLNKASLAKVPHIEDDLQDQITEEPSLQAETTSTTIEQSTPKTLATGLSQGPLGSAPPTPRVVPFMSLESATEQEDLYRKLRASAPPKSDAGSSMVADDDDGIGNIAEDPKPTILETQSKIQEGILRSKISDETTDEGVLAANLLPLEDRGTTVQSYNGSTTGAETQIDNEKTMPRARAAMSTGAAYGNSVSGGDVSAADITQPDLQSGLRAGSPSMTERGAAVQESVFRSKIISSEDGNDEDQLSARSVKSSILVEPAAASVDGSVHENREETMLDRQASVQETLFREKLDRAHVPPRESAGNLSLLGQAHAPSSAGGSEAVNQEPTLLQQQNDVQENIFRDKVDKNDRGSARTDPASLDHMSVHEVAQNTELLQDRPLLLPTNADSTADIERLSESNVMPTADTPYRTIEEFHDKADLEQAIESAVGDEAAAEEAHEFLQMELEAEPEERLATTHELNDASSTDHSNDMTNDLPAVALATQQSGIDGSSPILIDSDDEDVDSEQDSNLDETGHDRSDDEEEETYEVDDNGDDYGSQQDDQAYSTTVEDGAYIAQLQPEPYYEEDEDEDDQGDVAKEGSGNSVSAYQQDVEVDVEGLQDLLDRHDSQFVSEGQGASLEEYDISEDLYLQNSQDGSQDAESVLEYPPSEPQLVSGDSQAILEAIDRADYVLVDPLTREETGLATPNESDDVSSDGLGDDVALDEDEMHHDEEVPEALQGLIATEVLEEQADSPVPIKIAAKLDDASSGTGLLTAAKNESSIEQAEQTGTSLASTTAADTAIHRSPKQDVKPEAGKQGAPAQSSGEPNTEQNSVVAPDDHLLTELSFNDSIASFAYDKVVDVIGITFYSTVSRTKGPDYVWTATVLQPSGKTCRVSIFRPYKISLPAIEDGDVLLLRNFKVLSFMRELYLRSQEDSAWAIFSHSSTAISTPGPPIEYTSAEMDHAKKLSTWWAKKGHQLMPPAPTKRAVIALPQVREGLFFDIRGELVIKPKAMVTPFIIYITDYSKSSDGMQILDTLGSLGLIGEHSECLYLAVELRLQDAKYALHMLEVGDQIELKNVLGRLGNDDRVYGSIYPRLNGNPYIQKLD